MAKKTVSALETTPSPVWFKFVDPDFLDDEEYDDDPEDDDDDDDACYEPEPEVYYDPEIGQYCFEVTFN